MALVRGKNGLVLLAKATLPLGAQAWTPAFVFSRNLTVFTASLTSPFLLAPSYQHLDRIKSLTPQQPFTKP